jgi:enterochelin esterase-like enzyme
MRRPFVLTRPLRRLQPTAIAVLAAALVAAGCGNGGRTTPAAEPPPPRGSGHTVEGSFGSVAIKGAEHYAAYLPAGYDRGNKRYPVIYALHGLPSDAEGYRDIPVGDWGRAAERDGRPAIVIAPQGARPGDTDPEWHDWGPGRSWETMVSKELVEHVDQSYRTIANRRGRGIVGISAGGYGASIIGITHPDVYSVIESWSGYFHPTDPAGSQPLELGSPEADSAASVHTYVARAKAIFERWRPTYFGFYVGDADPHFLSENEELHRELLAGQVPHVYSVYPGAHSSAFWQQHEQDWITAAVENLDQAR